MKICVYFVVENEWFKMFVMFLEICVGINNLFKVDLWDRVFLYSVVIIKDIKVKIIVV